MDSLVDWLRKAIGSFKFGRSQDLNIDDVTENTNNGGLLALVSCCFSSVTSYHSSLVRGAATVGAMSQSVLLYSLNLGPEQTHKSLPSQHVFVHLFCLLLRETGTQILSFADTQVHINGKCTC